MTLQEILPQLKSNDRFKRKLWGPVWASIDDYGTIVYEGSGWPVELKRGDILADDWEIKEVATHE